MRSMSANMIPFLDATYAFLVTYNTRERMRVLLHLDFPLNRRGGRSYRYGTPWISGMEAFGSWHASPTFVAEFAAGTHLPSTLPANNGSPLTKHHETHSR